MNSYQVKINNTIFSIKNSDSIQIAEHLIKDYSVKKNIIPIEDFYDILQLLMKGKFTTTPLKKIDRFFIIDDLEVKYYFIRETVYEGKDIFFGYIDFVTVIKLKAGLFNAKSDTIHDNFNKYSAREYVSYIKI